MRFLFFYYRLSLTICFQFFYRLSPFPCFLLTCYGLVKSLYFTFVLVSLPKLTSFCFSYAMFLFITILKVHFFIRIREPWYFLLHFMACLCFVFYTSRLCVVSTSVASVRTVDTVPLSLSVLRSIVG